MSFTICQWCLPKSGFFKVSSGSPFIIVWINNTYIFLTQAPPFKTQIKFAPIKPTGKGSEGEGNRVSTPWGGKAEDEKPAHAKVTNNLTQDVTGANWVTQTIDVPGAVTAGWFRSRGPSHSTVANAGYARLSQPQRHHLSMSIRRGHSNCATKK